ncbi:MAG: hypothetical protein JXD23_11040 [Spirochaetales bacterium]|nr:hypothetical protein [Spirochaetales bacterium]
MRNIVRAFFVLIALLLASCAAENPAPVLEGGLLEEYSAAKADYYNGLYAKAEAAFRRLSEARGGFFQARLMQGKALFSLGRTAEAEAVFCGLAGRSPAFHEAGLWAARAETANGKAGAALERLRRLLACDSSDPRLLAAYAGACAARKDAAQALLYYRLSSQYEEELALNRLETARYYYRFGMYDKALPEIDRCLLLLADGSALRGSVEALRGDIMLKKGEKK